MTEALRRQGPVVNVKRVRRLMRRMALPALYPKRSCPVAGSYRAQNRLRRRAVDRCDQVWSSDMTYIRMPGGLAYWVAVMDSASRYVLAWTCSNTPDASICAEGYRPALSVGTPDIFHTDQGVPYGSKTMLRLSKIAGVQVSMSGAGRGYDPILIERRGRTVQHEEGYRRDYETRHPARQYRRAFFVFYNDERPHQAWGYRTPADVYFGSDRRGAAPPSPVPLHSTQPNTHQ